MTDDEVRELTPGIYRLYMNDGSTHIAAVGRDDDVRRWYAPYDWTGGVVSRDWSGIVSARRMIVPTHLDDPVTPDPPFDGLVAALRLHPGDVPTVLAFADLLEERAGSDAAAPLRSVWAGTGDLVIIGYDREAAEEDLERMDERLARIKAGMLAAGRDVHFVLCPKSWTVRVVKARLDRENGR